MAEAVETTKQRRFTVEEYHRMAELGILKPDERVVVEVAASSLLYDLNAKAAQYAEASVPEYWVVNLVHRELVVFRPPVDRTYHRSGERVAPESWPDVVIDVGELLPRDRD